MESIKRKWGKPGLDVQVFMPNDFIAACAPDATYVTYEFWCDAGSGNYKAWLDKGTIGSYDSQDESLIPYGYKYSPCNETHSVTVPKGTSIDNIFPRGLIRKYTDEGYDRWGRYYIDWSGDYIAVRIWKGEDNDDVHCTTQLSESEFTEKNPS